MPDVPDFQRNQGRGGENHQKLGPSFLHVNADAFGKQYRAIKKRQDSGRAQRAARKRVLQLVQQKNYIFAVMQEQLVVRPIGNLIEPNRPAIEEEKRKAQQKQQEAFENFEERDDFEVTNATLFLQNYCGNVRRTTHSSLFVELFHSAMTGFALQQISNLLPSGSSKKNP